MPSAEISQDVLAEGCYYLSKLGLSHTEIARHFECSTRNVSRLVKSYSSKLASGLVVDGDADRKFWENVVKEAKGDFRLTVVSERGFHHIWKSELQRLDGRALMLLYESSRDFLGADQNQKFLDYSPPKGYDPLAIDREIRRATEVLQELLEGKWKESRPKNGKRRPKLK